MTLTGTMAIWRRCSVREHCFRAGMRPPA